MTTINGDIRCLSSGFSAQADISDYPQPTGRSSPIQWAQIAIGTCHDAALSTKGELYTWGRADAGQLGTEGRHKWLPTRVAALANEKVIKVLCGKNVTLALTAQGKVFSWGHSFTGSLGHGPNERGYIIFPKLVKALDGKMVVDISYTAALTSSGALYTWDSPWEDPTFRYDFGRNIVISLCGGGEHSACVMTGGELYTWGIEKDGRLGNGDNHCNGQRQRAPELVKGLIGIKCKQVSCGFSHTAVVTEDGNVFTFGNGSNGVLGHGDDRHRTIPTRVLALETKFITQVVCFSCTMHTMALTSSGIIHIWGSYDGDTRDSCGLPWGFNILMPEYNVTQIFRSWNYGFSVLVDPSPSPIREDQHLHFNNKEHHDITFMVGTKEEELVAAEDPLEPIYANKDILSGRSEYFEAMFRSQMREH